jgi:predicted alpha/beta-hydrolase family hydrolase
MTRSRSVSTPYGEGRLDVHAARGATAVLVLSHGAGNGVEARDLAALAAALPGQGVTVALFEQPWRVAGRRIATAPPTLDVGLQAAVRALRPRLPLVVGGRSAGARSAARCASGVGAVGCLALAFPLHPPGRPERSRVDELTGAGVPTLVVQGERDPMGRPEEFPEGTDLAVVPAADHGLRVPARGPLSQPEALALVVEATLEWLVREVTGNP